ncbi:pectin lyase fold/virulence factor [Tirmania nivea]|nr:pectin lyase fold/virulence factor [Tirmania nivea]
MASPSLRVVPLTTDTETKSTILHPWSSFRSPNTHKGQYLSAKEFLEEGSRKLGGWLRQGINMSFNASTFGMKHLKKLKYTHSERYLQQHQQAAQVFDGVESEVLVEKPIIPPPPEDVEYVVVYKPSATNQLRGPESLDCGLPEPFYSPRDQVPLVPPRVISRDASIESTMSQVIEYHQHPWYARSGDYEVTANGVPLDVISLTSYDYVHFMVPSADGLGMLVEVVITVRVDNTVQKFKLSPQKLGMAHQVEGNKLTFSMNSHAYVIAQLNNHREIVILCDPAETDVPPPSGMGVHNVMDPAFGADNSGATYSTKAFQTALDSASASVSPESGKIAQSKQAIVYVPAGLYMLENIILPSNTALYLEPGSVLRFSGVAKDYIVHWHKHSQNRDVTWWISTAFNSSNIRIYGRGTIDGFGWASTNQASPRIGNNIIVPIACNKFSLEGIIIRDSGSWGVTLIRCSDVTVNMVKMLNRLDMGENDTFCSMESHRVTVTNCIGISLDDPFSTKTWGPDTDIAKSWPGEPQAQENVLFENCLSWTRCFGFKVGQGVIQPQKDIVFKDCVIHDAAIGFGINHRYGAASAEGIHFLRCEVERVTLTLVGRRTWFACFTERGSASLGVGPVRNVLIEECRVWDRGETRVELKGFNSEEGIVDTMVFKNVEMMDLIGEGRVDGRARNLEELGVDPEEEVFVERVEVVVDP